MFGLDGHRHSHPRQRPRARRQRRARHAAALRARERPRAEGAPLRLRPRPVRRVLGAHRRRRAARVRDARRVRRRAGDYDPRRAPRVVRRAARARERPGAASDPAGDARRAGAAVRVLLQRHDRQGRGAARAERVAERRGDSLGDERPHLPLRHLSPHHQRDPARGREHAERGMSTAPSAKDAQAAAAPISRRAFLKAGGALVVGFSLGLTARPGRAQTEARGAAAGPPDAELIDTWLAIHADNTATLYIGFVELGQGTTTALPQIAAEELDLALEQISTAQHDTHVTPNQGGTYSSASVARGGPQVRRAAAEARQALLQLASERLGAPVDALRVENGVVTAAGTDAQVTYGELIGGRLFEIPFTGTAPVKRPEDYKIVGVRAPRKDLP